MRIRPVARFTSHGDCNGLLQCQAFGQPPNTLVEYALNQFNNIDFYDISLVDGFNVPMDLSPVSGKCRGVRCATDINAQCPNQLRSPGGCNNPCTVFKTDQYCCNSGNCAPTDFSRFFKQRCPDAYSYPQDDQTSTFTCPGGTNYRGQDPLFARAAVKYPEKVRFISISSPEALSSFL
uniref:Thaumatin-like protein n=1 Tax=Salix viminalis TaxID=40686 RepID=A0A6N2MDC7_SALVM